MRRYLPVLLLLLVLLSGCARHFYTVKAGTVHLYLRASDAGTVYVASSLDGYALHELMRNEEGMWETALPAQQEFRYFYIVDGQVFVPPCRLRERDDFGSENCVYCPDL
jgi:hypothetical protein